MIRTIKPKNARSKRAFEKSAPKVNENPKAALFVPGSTGTKILHDSMCDLMAMKKPLAKKFSKKNEIRPFEDHSSLEFFSEKNDSSIIIFSSSSKKRPNMLTFSRFFNYKLYDMVELLITNHKLLQDFKRLTFTVGLKPMFVFNGPEFEVHPRYMQLKSLFLDLYRGEETDLIDVAGLQYVISISTGEIEDPNSDKLNPLHFRVYKLKSYKSGQKLPRIELEEIGPRFDFKIGRFEDPAPELQKEATTKPKQSQPKEKKNVSTDSMGDKVAQIHVGKQDLAKLQTRKMKGLKPQFDQVSEPEDDVLEFENDIEFDEPAPKKSKK